MNTLSSNLFFLLIILGFSSSIQTQTITSDHLFLIQEKGKFGYINNKGEVVIPTIYKDAGQFKEGLAPVAVDGYIGFIDTNNNLVIPAQYDFAESFSEGCALVYQNGKPYFINQDGSHIFDINEQFSDLITDEKEDHPFFDAGIQCGNFKNGYATIKKNRKTVALLNIEGTLWGGKIFKEINLPFSEGIVKVRDESGFGIMDIEGKIIVPFGKYGTINTKGEWVSKLRDKNVEDYKKLGDWYYQVGLHYIDAFNMKTGNKWVKHCSYVNQAGFQNGLIWIMEKDGRAYIDINGKYIWQQSFPTSSASTMDTLDVFHQRQAQICVQPSNKKIIGFSSESPFPRAKKVPWFHDFQDNQISITLKDAPKDTIKGNFATKRYYITNLTQDTFNFATDTGRLYAKLQALNKSGEWENIEALQNSGCGNAYYQFPLYPNEYWTGLIPLYKGGFKTQLRLAVFQFRKYGEPFENEIYMYSPPFKGSINPAQFWRRQANNLNKNIDIAVNYRRLGF